MNGNAGIKIEDLPLDVALFAGVPVQEDENTYGDECNCEGRQDRQENFGAGANRILRSDGVH